MTSPSIRLIASDPTIAQVAVLMCLSPAVVFARYMRRREVFVRQEAGLASILAANGFVPGPVLH